MALVAGQWEVVTETSTYVIDVDAMTATRLPSGAGSLDGATMDRERLRLDAQVVPLLAVPEPVVGQPCVLLLAMSGDGVATVRRTNLVCHATRLR